MENIDKVKTLLNWLAIEDIDEEIEYVDEFFDIEYEYQGITYRIYSEEELDNELTRIVKDFAKCTQQAIENLPDDIEYRNYMTIGVDDDAIYEDILENIANYVGVGEVQEYDGYYIFPIV